MKEKIVFGIYYDDELGITRNKILTPIEMIPEVCLMIERENKILKKKWTESRMR